MIRFQLFLLLLLSGCAGPLWAQYALGHKTQVFNDPARNNRAVSAEIYYPATAAGDDQALAAGVFPVVVFGHGFVMSTGAYLNVAEALAPAGFVVCLPSTESGFAPGHDNFARDLAFLAATMQAEGASTGSFWQGHIANRTALMGHSMGGGAALLGTPLYAGITATAVFAPAETTPSAIGACAQIQNPVLMFTGSQDCITPTANHAGPMFAALDSVCKTHVDITGGNHCYFGDYNFNCNFGETTTGCSPGISREQQHEKVFALLLPWLRFYLYDQADQWAVFQEKLGTTEGLVVTQDCPTATAAPSPATPITLRLSPNPALRELLVQTSGQLEAPPSGFTAIDSAGRSCELSFQALSEGWMLDVSALPPGFYHLRMRSKKGEIRAGFIKN